MQKESKQFDEQQLLAIHAHDGRFLVLAPPGCGKTDILAERIAAAHEKGVPFDSMLCLTFTNRASRGMRARIAERVGDDASGVFVGNLHRFCSHFLFDNNLLPSNASIIDEEDCHDILESLDTHHFLYTPRDNFDREKATRVMNVAAMLRQAQLGQPSSVFIAPVATEQKFLDIARQNDYDYNKVGDRHPDDLIARYALQYLEYKSVHQAIDFNDILLLAYFHLTNDTDRVYKRYSWVQVDEVQDLNALQLALVELLIDTSAVHTVMMLGDEQQAIFAFLGAKRDLLDELKRKCTGRVMNLGKNYRSPKYLLDIFNDYAVNVLGVNRSILPEADNCSAQHDANDIILAQSHKASDEALRVRKMVNYYLSKDAKERIAVILPTNKGCDTVSDSLEKFGVSHFKISGKDMFRTKHYRTMASLIGVAANENNDGAWSRLLYGTGACKRIYNARKLLRFLHDYGMTPADLMSPLPFLKNVADIYTTREIVLFDTETTGLNVAEDDIVQIAAFKVKNGVKVAGSDFNIFLHTEREIPPMLGDLVNPLVEEYERHGHLTRDDGLRKFLHYVGDDTLMGHNVTFDKLILQSNVKRDLNKDVDFETIDTLQVIKRIEPRLLSYKLVHLLEELHLEGANSHLADEDIEATMSLMCYCMKKVETLLPKQEELFTQPRIKGIINILRNISPIYDELRQKMLMPLESTEWRISDVFEFTHRRLCEMGHIAPLGSKFDLFLQYISQEWNDSRPGDTLSSLVGRCINDFTNSVNEGDLVNSEGLIKDRVFVMTVHKAKGLEFENVILLNAIDGHYPFFQVQKKLASRDAHLRAEGEKEWREDARKFYVALSRAKRRLCVSYSVLNDFGYETALTPFMKGIEHHFKHIGEPK